MAPYHHELASALAALMADALPLTEEDLDPMATAAFLDEAFGRTFQENAEAA